MWHARGRLGAAVGTAAKWVHLNSATQICGVPLPAAARSRRADTIAASVVASVVAHDSLCTLRAGSRSSPAVHDALSTGMSASKSKQSSLSVPRWSVGCHVYRPSAACASRSASTTRRRLTAPSSESHSRSSEATKATSAAEHVCHGDAPLTAAARKSSSLPPPVLPPGASKRLRFSSCFSHACAINAGSSLGTTVRSWPRRNGYGFRRKAPYRCDRGLGGRRRNGYGFWRKAP